MSRGGARAKRARLSESARRRAIAESLLELDRTCDKAGRLHADPIGIVRERYQRPRDLELAGLVGACLAFGNAKALRAKVADAFDRLGSSLAVADDELEVFARLAGWKHRVYRGEDLARLLIGARRVQRSSRTLGARFELELRAADGDLKVALASFRDAIADAGGLTAASAHGRRGPGHILPDPKKQSGCKRLLLYLRWMVRKDDGVDLGLWRNVSPSVLLIPVDTHVFKLARNLGFTQRKSAGWATTTEITNHLREIDGADPVRFDFALCHLGMLQGCPSRRDPDRCEGCGVKRVCVHWQK